MADNTDDIWQQSSRIFQQSMTDGWKNAFASFQNMDLGAANANWKATDVKPPKISFSPKKLQQLQRDYLKEVTELWNNPPTAPKFDDRRFADPAWSANPATAFSVAAYLLNSKVLMQMVDTVKADDMTLARIRFTVEQMIAAAAPSNFMALNAEAHQKAIDSNGESIAKGVQNLVRDIGQGRLSMTDESQFVIGKNVATTEGAVVFENDIFQLIEYKPLTDTVYERPLLLIPACINKFYILDLQPDNSVIRYAVSQGYRTFVVSWRNPDASMGKKTWHDYIEDGAIKAIMLARQISGADAINALGFCVGGTILSNALAVLAARGEKAVCSATFLTSLIDFTDTGILSIFIGEQVVKYREQELAGGGLMKGADMASIFSFLRPNELVWNYVVGNYLKGETPPPFDLLYWNADSTNLPGPFYTWYLRNTYLENNLIKPGVTTVCGEKIDFGQVDMPAYIYCSREDHIVPISGAYATTQHLPGNKRFVMGASGHIAGVINPPTKNKRCYWIREDGQLPKSVEQWQEGATEHPGSWWPDWTNWLAGLSGKQVAAPKTYGKGKLKAIEPAPGRYVLVRA